MHLYLCPECERGNHGRCYRATPSSPPGSYGGSKCRCGCDGNADYDIQKTAPAGHLLEVLNPKPAGGDWFTIGDHWYWAIYECRLACIQASPKNDGFWTHGQEWLHPWREARIIGEATPPNTRMSGRTEPGQ